MHLFISFKAIGFNVETVSYKNLKFQVWDLGGQTSIRLVHVCHRQIDIKNRITKYIFVLLLF